MEDNPERILEPTEAYKARIAIPEYEEKETQDPLFKCHTFSVDQVCCMNFLPIYTGMRIVREILMPVISFSFCRLIFHFISLDFKLILEFFYIVHR